MTKQRCVRIFHFLWGRGGVTVYAVLAMHVCIFGCLPALAAAEKRVQCGSYTFIVPEGFKVLYKKREAIPPWEGSKGWNMDIISPADSSEEEQYKNTVWCITATNIGNKPFATRFPNEISFDDAHADFAGDKGIVSVPLVDVPRNDVRIYNIDDNILDSMRYHLGEFTRFVLELQAKDKPEHVFIHVWIESGMHDSKHYGYGIANALLASLEGEPTQPQAVVEIREGQRVSCGDFSFVLPAGFSMHYKATRLQQTGEFKGGFSISFDNVPHNSSELPGSAVCIAVSDMPENWSCDNRYKDMPPVPFFEQYSDQRDPVHIEHKGNFMEDGFYPRDKTNVYVQRLQSGSPFSFQPTSRYLLQFQLEEERPQYFLSVYEKTGDAERANYYSRFRGILESVRYEAPAASRGSQPDTSSKQKQAPAKQKQTAAKQKQTVANQNSVR